MLFLCFCLQQDGLEQEVAVKICKVTDDENKRKSEARVEKFLEEACEFLLPEVVSIL